MPVATPSILRRLSSMFYEVLLLGAVLLIAAFLFTVVTRNAQTPLIRLLFQLYLLSVWMAYFVGFWVRGGQTLPMKTWRLRLVNRDGGKVGVRQACLRFLLALIGVPLLFGVWWALFDPDRQFWHDRAAGTRIVTEPPAVT